MNINWPPAPLDTRASLVNGKATMLFGHPYLTPWHFILFFVVVLDILAGVLILLRGRKDLRTVFFAVLLFFAALWGLMNFFSDFLFPYGEEYSLFAMNSAFVTASGLSLCAVLLARVFPSRKPVSKFYILVVSAPLLFVSIASYAGWINTAVVNVQGHVNIERGWFYPFSLLIILGYWIWALTEMHLGLRSVPKEERSKAIVVILGLTFAFVVGSFFNVFWHIIAPDSPLSFIGPIGVLGLVWMIGWGVLRYQLFDVYLRVERQTIVSLLTLIAFVFGLVFFSFLVLQVHTTFWLLLPVIFVFSMFFLFVRNAVAHFLNIVVLNEYLENRGGDVRQHNPTVAQFVKFEDELRMFFQSFFPDAQVKLFGLEKGRYEPCRRVGSESIFFATDEPLVNAVRASRGVMFVESAAFRDLIAREHQDVVMRKFRKVGARAVLGLPHWTNELVMITFVGMSEPTPEQQTKLRMHLEFNPPKWDEIAARIYTNKRALESLPLSSNNQYGNLSRNA